MNASILTAMAASGFILSTHAFALEAVEPVEVSGSYVVASDGYQTRIVHPMIVADRIFVEQVSFEGNCPFLTGKYPSGATIEKALASMVSGLLTYRASIDPISGQKAPETIHFYRTEGVETAGIHATVVFDGPERPTIVEASVLSAAEWETGQNASSGRTTARSPGGS